MVDHLFDSWMSDWELIYSTDKHGRALKRMYNACGRRQPCVLVVEATPADVDVSKATTQRFGIFLPAPLQAHARVPHIGAAAVFTLAPDNRKAYTYRAHEGGADGLVAVFDDDYVAFGANADSTEMALQLNRDLLSVRRASLCSALTPGTLGTLTPGLQGSTSASSLFKSPPLMRPAVEGNTAVTFTVACVEVFALVGEQLVDVGL